MGYFKVPKARYPEFVQGGDRGELKIEILLTTGKKFDQVGKIGAIEGDLSSEAGEINIRADFPNPDRLLHHGETGIVLFSRVQKDALVIPTRAVLEDDGKRYVYVVDRENVDIGGRSSFRTNRPTASSSKKEPSTRTTRSFLTGSDTLLTERR